MQRRSWFVIVGVLFTVVGGLDAQSADPSAKAKSILQLALKAYKDEVAGYQRSANFRVVYKARTLGTGAGPSIRSTWTLTGNREGHLRVERASMGETETYGHDGEKYWWIPSGAKEAVAAPSSLVTAMKFEHVQRNLLLDYEAKGFTVTLGRSEVGSPGVNRVIFLRKGADRENLAPGDRFQMWFDASHRVTRFTALHPSPAGGKPVSVSIHYKDYKLVDGIPVAGKQVIRHDEKEAMELTLQQAEFGKDYKPETFQP